MSRHIGRGWYHLRTMRNSSGSSRARSTLARGPKHTDVQQRRRSFEDSAAQLPGKAVPFAGAGSEDIPLSTVSVAVGTAAPRPITEDGSTSEYWEIGMKQEVSCEAEMR